MDIVSGSIYELVNCSFQVDQQAVINHTKTIILIDYFEICRHTAVNKENHADLV